VDKDILLPPGEFVLVNGSRVHVRRSGSTGPTILFEAGLTMMSSCWGWLAPALAPSRRTLVYDRAGLGWSDEREGLRDAGQIARELDMLLNAAQVHAPVVLLGHSMGAILNRAFLRLNPARVAAVIWLDPAHPDQLPRSRRMRSFFFLLEFAHVLAARNLPSITLRIVPHLRGLPEHEYRVIRHFLKDPRHLRACAREARAWTHSADNVGQTTLGSTPLLVISAQKHALGNWREYQRELALLSTRSRHVTFTEMSHLSMLANREHAERVAGEVSGFLDGLKL
jgi:pimeloyl-ACP methyl ester carboxylesterase